MTETPTTLDYLTPPRASRFPISVAGALAVVGLGAGLVAFMIPPVSGSGRMGPNIFYVPAWCIAFVLYDVSVWIRLWDPRPVRLLATLVLGVGATGVLASLAAMLLMWKPAVPLLAAMGVISLAIAAVGGWMRAR